MRAGIVLLPAAYQRGGFHVPASEGQRRFCDPSVDVFLDRVERLRAWAEPVDGVSVGVAVHSVRAVPGEWIEAVADYADRHGLVRHVHAAEQRRELEECQTEHGCSPIELLHRCGFLGQRTSVVHGIHVSPRDIELLAHSRTIVVTCPTTEGNLGDGILPALRYRDAGVRLAIGTDEQVRIDPFEELREMETLARREGQTRDALLAAAGGDLWGATGWPTAWPRSGCRRRRTWRAPVLRRGGRRRTGGAAAGQITINLDHPDLAGVAERDLRPALVTCASAGVVARGVEARGGGWRGGGSRRGHSGADG